MSEDAAAYMVAPTTNGDAPLPRRNGSKSLLPSTWLQRTLRVEYVNADGLASTTTGTLLDLYPAGPIFNVGGRKTLIAWERLVVVELVPD